MATYKVGQRVKFVAGLKPEHQGPGYEVAHDGLIGDVGTVYDVASSRLPPDAACAVLFDGSRSKHLSGAFAVRAYQIVPLTDPKADEFIERIKKIAREPAPVPVKTERHEENS